MPSVSQEYAKFLEESSYYQHAGEGSVLEFCYLTLGLAGEAGEFADTFKKGVRTFGFSSKSRAVLSYHEELTKELGDVLWYLVRLCDMLNVSIVELMLFNTYKLITRHRELGRKYDWPFEDPRASEKAVKAMLDIREEIFKSKKP